MKKTIALLLCTIICVFGVCLSCGAVNTSDPFENSRYYTQGDYTIHYRVFEPEGEKKGNIFFLHGFGLSTSSFDEIIPYFTAAGYLCVAADLPNMGYSVRETESTEIIDRETLMYNLMKSITEENWILAGHSLGGGVSVNIATDHPEAVEKMLLFAPQTIEESGSYGKISTGSAFTHWLFDIIIKYGTRSRLLMTLVMYAAMQDNSYAAGYDVDLIREPLQIENTGRGFAIMSENARCIDYEKVKALNIPTLIVRGGKDNVAVEDNIQRLESSLQNVQCETIEDTGHMMTYTRAERLFELSYNFLNK